tara:strand:+ start:4060 stop:4374 length:315 start_codon:yes stop_codon:yes gene_type:complete
MKNKHPFNSKKVAMIVGIQSPIRYKTKEEALRKLYKKAKSNPFTDTRSFGHYIKFLADRMIDMENIKVKSLEPKDIFDTLKRIGWLREKNYLSFYMVTTNHGIA